MTIESFAAAGHGDYSMRGVTQTGRLARNTPDACDQDQKVFSQKWPKEIDTKECGRRRGGKIGGLEVNRLNFGFFLTIANFVEYGVSLPKLHIRPRGIPGAQFAGCFENSAVEYGLYS